MLRHIQRRLEWINYLLLICFDHFSLTLLLNKFIQFFTFKWYPLVSLLDLFLFWNLFFFFDFFILLFRISYNNRTCFCRHLFHFILNRLNNLRFVLKVFVLVSYRFNLLLQLDRYSFICLSFRKFSVKIYCIFCSFLIIYTNSGDLWCCHFNAVRNLNWTL